MKNITFTVVTLIVIGMCVTVGYFALTWMKNPSDYVASKNDTIGDMVNIETSDTESQSPLNEPVVVPEAENKNITLANNIQKILDAQTVLKLGTEGQSVSYIQEFLNGYFGQTKAITSKFTQETETDYKKFQSQNGLPVTGQVGNQGLAKIIEWLKKN